MKSYLSLIPISARVRRRQNRLTILCIVTAVFLVTAIFSVADMMLRTQTGRAAGKSADTAASRIASALGAENLILMTDIRGLLRDKDDETSLIPEVNVSEVPFLVKQGIISGGMIPKIECCVEAVRRGVQKTCIIDGRIPHSILIEILSNEGIGTLFK